MSSSCRLRANVLVLLAALVHLTLAATRFCAPSTFARRRFIGWGVLTPSSTVSLPSSCNLPFLLLRGGVSISSEEKDEDAGGDDGEEDAAIGIDDVEELNDEFSDKVIDMEDVQDDGDKENTQNDLSEEEPLVDEPEVELVMDMGEEEETDEVPIDPVPEEATAVDEEVVTEPEPAFPPEEVADDPTIDDDSSAFVDRMELADAYDEGETTPGSFEADESAQPPAATADATAALAEGEAAAAANVPTEITKEMKKALKALDYSRREIYSMRPDVAAIVIEKEIKRPEEGMPINFYVGGQSTEPKGWRKIVPRVVIPAIAVGLLVNSGINGEYDLPPQIASWLPQRKAAPVLAAGTTPTEETIISLPSAPGDMVAATSPVVAGPVSDSLPSAARSDVATTDTDDVVPVNEHLNALGEVHAHSIKPGVQDAEDELDVLWLDKLLTSIARAFRKLFRLS